MIGTLEEIDMMDDEVKDILDEQFLSKLKVDANYFISSPFSDSSRQTAQSQLSKYAEMVEETIDLDQLEHHQFVIKPNYDENLQILATEIEEVSSGDLQVIDSDYSQIREGMNEEHRSVGEDLGLDTEKKLHLENSQNHGYCLRVTRAVRELSSSFFLFADIDSHSTRNQRRSTINDNISSCQL
jgi:DNA mismatch repair protein MSH2